jgi:hypothetical protein
MINNELVQFSKISTINRTEEDFPLNCKIDEIEKLSDEGLDKFNKAIEKSVMDNFTKNDDSSECDFLNSEDDYYINLFENQNSFIGKKTKRTDKSIDEDKKIFNINYRHDYYIMAVKSDFLKFTKNVLNKLINIIKLCKKFGKHKINTPNRELYGGNPKEEDNREFIYKTVEEVFIDQGIKNDEQIEDENNIDEEKNKKGTSRQKDNEKIFNKIKEYQNTLSTKKNKDEKYKEQYAAIENLIKFLNTQIKDVFNQYYDSEEFGEFRSRPKIKYYDEKFMKERDRNLSLLEKNNFVKLVLMPYYSDKKKKK